ncbi:MAG: ATP phosphoribosyltransferase regulatory subunit, partial [Lachnospiraceae bacterium]|nr:ATP phosphoribosyltransferase regulatory subunit [Lachnospiraceae bacterium]
MNRDIHTPDGVRDVFGRELSEKRRIEGEIRTQMHRYGFQDIKPPTFEYFDVFRKEWSGISAKDLYKFFDKEGNTLVLRPDFTPQIARCVSKFFPDEGKPIRLCYEGDTFTNASELQGKLKETTQMGAELFSDGSVYADAEMIALLVDVLRSTGLKDFQISIGHAAFFHGICEEYGLAREEEDAIRALIADNNYFAAEKKMLDAGIDESYREILLKISDFVGNAEELLTLRGMVKNETSLAAIDRIKAVYDVLKVYGMQQYVSFDAGMLTRHHYYTGITFEAYTYGVGDAIAKGGRYDTLPERFGLRTPAIGFAVMVDELLNALFRQELNRDAEEAKTVTF